MRNSASWARFLALWPTLRRLIVEDGYPAKVVYRAARDEEVWSGGYSVFREHVLRARRLDAGELKVSGPGRVATRAEEASARPAEEGSAPSDVAVLDSRDIWSRIINPNAAKGPYVYGADDDE